MKIGLHVSSVAAIEEGVWEAPDAEHPEFEVRAKVRGPTYFKRNEKMHATWARQYGSKGAPEDIQRKWMAKLLFEECIPEIRGLTEDDGKTPISRERAEQISATFEGQPFYRLCLTAVIMAEAKREADAEDAEGNSAISSAGS